MKKLILVPLAFLSVLFLSAQSYLEMMDSPGDYTFYQIRDAAEAHFDQVGRGKGTGYNQYKRWEMHNELRSYPSGKIENWNQKAIDAYREYVQSDYFRNIPAEKTHNGLWTELGPNNWSFISGNGPGNGRINVVAFHPTNANILYAGAPLGGLWRSNDAGASWSSLTDGMPNLGVSGIAIHPTNPNIIYILTGDGNGRMAPSTGVLKTTDGGITWKKTGLDWNATTSTNAPQTNHPDYQSRGYKLIINPTNPNILFAATTTGMWRTTDGGNTWTNVRNLTFRDVAFQPGNPNTIYATTPAVLQRSTDGGNTWEQILTGSGLPENTDAYDRIAIGVTPANPQMVYLLYGGGNSGFHGLYRSTNGGTTFTRRSSAALDGSPNILSGTQDGSGTDHQAWYDLAIAVSPNDANTVYTGGINIWRSTNGGTNWAVQTNWRYGQAPLSQYVHADIHFLGYSGNTLWVGCDGGVFRTLSPGGSSPVWESRSNGLAIAQFYKICTSSTLIAGGTQDLGTNQLAMGGTPTASHVLGGDGFECFFTNQHFFASTQNGIHRKTPMATQWTNITPNITTSPSISAPWNVGWLLRPGSSTDLFYGGVGGTIRRSTNAGDSWTVITNAFGTEFNNQGQLIGNRVHHLAMSPSNTSRLYAASASISNIRRTDNCMASSPNFVWIGFYGSTSALSGLAVDPNNSNIVYACISGYQNGFKVLRSNDAGANWTNISGTLPNVPVHCIVHEGSNGGLYIGTDLGVFYRNNSTGGWLPFMNGLPSVMVTDLEIRSGEGRIYAGTFGRGIWRSNLYSSCSNNLTLTPANDPSQTNYTGYQYYTASNTITSTRVITGGVGTDVTYRANNGVRLNPGFHARPDNEFHAEIGGCNSVFQPIMSFQQNILEVFEHSGDALSTAEEDQAETDPIILSFDAHLRIPTRAFPNPFGVSFTVEVAAFNNNRTVRGEMYDLTGKLVQTISSQHVPQGMRLITEVYTDHLAPGVYILKVIEGDQVETFKLVKQ